MANKTITYPDINSYLILNKNDLNIMLHELNTILEYYKLNPYRNTIQPLIISKDNPNENNYIHDTIRLLKDKLDLQYCQYHFIINIDYSINNIKFIPIPQKYNGQCYYKYGRQNNQTLTSVDLLELMKTNYKSGNNELINNNNNIISDNIIIHKINSCIIFTKDLDNIHSQFISCMQTN